MSKRTDKLSATVLVDTVKYCSILHKWTPDQVKNPAKGVEDHLTQISAATDMWSISKMMFLVEGRQDLLTPVLNRFTTWTEGLTSMYDYLRQSPEPFPGSIATMGLRLVPSSKKDQENDTVDYLRRLAARVETTLLKGALHEQKAETESVKARLEMLTRAHVNSPSETKAVVAEIARLTYQLTCSEGREEYQQRFMDNLQRFLDLVTETTRVAESLVPDDETKP